jgi:maltose alpha-D-glucosyltransferase/alpha-amylase
MGDNLDLPDRDCVRTPMQWDDSPNAGFSSGRPFTELVKGELDYHHVNVAGQLTDRESLFHSIQHMIAVRKETTVLGRGNLTWLETNNPSVAAYVRQYADDSLLILNNLTSSVQTIRLPVEHHRSHVDLLRGVTLAITETTSLQPFSFLWLQEQR